jgi:hypothetical protein
MKPNMPKTCLLIMSLLSIVQSYAQDITAAIPVTIAHDSEGYYFLRGGYRYEVHGAGRDNGSLETLVASGGNSFRTWTTEGAGPLLDEAHRLGLTVALCLPVMLERWGFDYNDSEAVSAQLLKMEEEVLKYKDHPALLFWIIGNELNFDYTNSAVYDAVNDISKMIHRVDGLHPTTTAVAGLGLNVLEDLDARAENLDFLSFQVYGELANLPKFIRTVKPSRPIVITEWGPLGHWEVGQTSWGAPIELDSSAKAQIITKMYQENIEPLSQQVMASYVFLWGQKQERTATWYGMFTPTGEKTAVIDEMQKIWLGNEPSNRAPQVLSMALNSLRATDNITLRQGKSYKASVRVRDPDKDKLTYRWVLQSESQADQVGGDFEQALDDLNVGLDQQNSPKVSFTSPMEPGGYRLYMYAVDNQGASAHANIPFLVQ